MHKRILVLGSIAAIVLLLLPVIACAEESATSAYVREFEASAESTFLRVFAEDPTMKELGEEQIQHKAHAAAKAFGECHMLAMSAYSEKLQNVAYEAANAGGSYADAQAAFENALTAEIAAGGDAAEAVKKMMEQSIFLGGPCAEDAKSQL